jgi:hypothetical protein
MNQLRTTFGAKDDVVALSLSFIKLACSRIWKRNIKGLLPPRDLILDSHQESAGDVESIVLPGLCEQKSLLNLQKPAGTGTGS